MIIERQPITTNYNYNQIGHFKELSAGAGTKVFKANTAGVFAGSAAYGSAPFRLSYSGALYATSVDLTGKITATSGTFTGAIYAASGTFGGQLVAATGSISGDFLVSGSLYSDSSGFRTKIENGQITFLKSSSQNSYIRATTANNGLQIASKQSIFFTNMAGTPIITFGQDGAIQINAASYIQWAGGRGITADGSSLYINGDLRPDGNFTRDLGTTANKWNNIRGAYVHANSYFNCQGSNGKDFNSYGLISNVRWTGSRVERRWTEFTFKGGILTNISGQSGWENAD